MDTETDRIDIGDGRLIDKGALVPLPTPKTITRPKPKKSRSAKPKKTPKVRYKQTLYNKREPIKTTKRADNDKIGHGQRVIAERHAEIPGYTDWVNLRIAQMTMFRNKLGFPDWRRTGVPEGYDKKTAARMWAEATRKAKIDMDNLEKAGLLPDDDIAREATNETLRIMRSNVNVDLKLKAAAQLLTYYKAKPVQRTETKLDAAESWLAAIAQSDATE